MIPLLQLVQWNTQQEASYSVFLTLYHVYVRNILTFCTGLTMIRFLFGNSIECLNDNRQFSQSFMDIKCYINGTFTLVPGHPTLYHDYYQWVPVYLVLLAFGFHFPYSFWSQHYGNYLRQLENLAEKPNDMIQMIRETQGNFIFFKTIALEMFYIVYLVWLVSISNVFFNHLWSRFHWSWRAIYKIFPDDGMCYFEYHHGSGVSENKLNCILPLCSIYRKIFFTLYILVWVLMVVNAWLIVYRILLVLYKRKFVNTWWAFKIAEQCMVSWPMKKEIQCAMKNRKRNPGDESIKMQWMV